MTAFGSATLARTIANVEFEETQWGTDYRSNLPEGWTYLSQGSYRATFLGPDGVVYKRAHFNAKDEWHPNLVEWQAYCQLMEANFHHDEIVIPRTRFFKQTYILAMQYVPGERLYSIFDESVASMWIEFCGGVGNQFGFFDWENASNILWYENKCWVVDFGM